MSPRISCLMPVYNGEQYLDEAIGSILAQTLTDFEFVIVDDGSRDATPDILARHAAADGRIRVVTQANGGIVAALNAGLAQCRGDYVARMDADDIAVPERFEKQARYLDSHPGCVLVGGLARGLGPSGELYALTKGGRHSRTDLGVFPPRVAVSVHPLITVRRSALEAIGGYSGDFPHAEDYDLFIRLARLGTVDNPPEVMLHYRRHAGALSVKHLDVQERSAAMAEVTALRANGMTGITEALIESYVRVRIWRRLLLMDRPRAMAMMPALLAEVASLAPRDLNRHHMRLRYIILGATARNLINRTRRAMRGGRPAGVATA